MPPAAMWHCIVAMLSYKSDREVVYEDFRAALSVALVEERLWEPLQAIAYAIQLPNESQRILTLAELVPAVAACGLPA